MTAQNLADLYMLRLETQMENASWFLYNMARGNSDCIVMMEQEGGYPYERAKMMYIAALRQDAEVVDGADGYFYSLKEAEEFVAYGGSRETEKIRTLMEERQGEQDLVGWHLYQLGDEQYLVYVYRADASVDYGAWLNLEKLRPVIRDGVEYENTQISWSEQEENAGERELAAVSAEGKGIFLHIGLDRGEVTEGLSVYQRALQVTAALEILVIPLLYLLLQRILIKPLKRINEAHREIENGNQEYRIGESGRSREYEVAFRGFNSMAERLRFYRIEAYEKELARQKMELQNLQLQIRPHFLLNTFNLIYTLAQNGQDGSVQDIVMYLSDYFRYLFRSGRELELFSKELAMIRGYIQTAAIRYQGRVELECDLDPELAFVRTPPLLIHNFIENAVKYGVKEGKELHIFLRGEYEDRTVTFCISDDGNGMDAETLAKNRRILDGEELSEEGNSHLGLRNSYKRLKYFYGEEARIELESEPGEMTSFTIRFPYNVEVDDESVDGK